MKKLLVSVLVLVLSLSLLVPAFAEYDPIGFYDGEVKLPLTDTPVTFTRFFNMDAAKISPTTDNFGTIECYKLLEEKTGVHIEFIHPPIGQEKEKFNLMIASDELPDMIHYNWGSYSGGPQKAIDDGIILRLNDLIDQYCPNLKYIIDNNADVKKAISTDSGDIYCFPYLMINQLVNGTYGYQLRADWLEELGLAVPESIDDWYNVLNAFKTKGTNAAGSPIIPLVSMNPSYNQSAVRRFANAWGIDYDFYQMNKAVGYGPYTNAYKDYLTTMKKWYEEGLIDIEFPTCDEATHDAKVTAGTAGAWLNGIGAGMGKYIKAFDGHYELIKASKYPVVNKGDTIYSGFVGQIFAGGAGTAISTSCKDPALAAKWLDYHYSRDGHMILNWGIEGVSYELDANGVPHVTDLMRNHPNGYSIDVALCLYTMGASSEAYCQDPNIRTTRFWNTPTQEEATTLWADVTSIMLPALSYSNEESEELTSIMSEINTYRDEMFLKFVLGTEPIENFDKYIAQMKSMGMDRALEIRQAALDRYNDR